MKKFWMILPLGLAFSCAKTRPTERVPDVNENRFEKAPLLAHETWIAKETVVATDPLGGFGFTGLQSSVVAGKFEFSKDKLRFIRAAHFEANNETLDSTVYSWDVDHSEYRLAESGGKVSNREEENNYLEWFKKRYFKTNLSEADLTLMDTKGQGTCFEQVDKSLVPDTQSITSDRITFEVDYTYKLADECFVNYIQRSLSGQSTHTARVRYSFIPLPQETGYTPFRFQNDTDPLFDKYGFFTSTVERKNEQNRLENVFFMNRWHPEKTHTFYFAPGFPEEYKWLYNHPEFGVMPRTNALLAKNQVKMRFEILDAPAGISFGDLGYSFIKFVEHSEDGSPLGYGPSDENPFTGQLLSANTIVWTSGLKYYVERLKKAQESADSREDLRSSDLFSKISDIFGKNSGPADWTATGRILSSERLPDGESRYISDSGRLFHFLLPKYTYAPYSLYSLPLSQQKSAALEVAKALEQKLGTFAAMKPLQVNPELFKRLSSSSFNREAEAAQGYYQDRFEVESQLAWLSDLTREVKDVQNAKALQRKSLRAADPTTIHYFDESELGTLKGDKVLELSAEQIVDNILYKVAIHEFGHNLNLRHNFMGSVDEKNFHPDSPLFDRTGQTLKDREGKDLLSINRSASVMDYLDLFDEIRESFEWGRYDEAALVFAYTGGQRDLAKEKNELFLYCTDEHRELNAMCNAYDTGATPSQVALSLIENYDNSYEVTNRRFDRAYWSSFGYANARFESMMQLRKFLPFAFQTYAATLDKELSNFNFDPAKREEIRRDIKNDQNQAAMLVAAFYHAVIQQSAAERPFLDDVTKNGSLRPIGIGPDKLYAAYFLFGSPEIPYSVQDYAAPYSFLSLRSFSNQFDKILRANLTTQPDAYQGFINFGRMLYAETVTNYVYSSDYELRSRSDLKCLSAQGLEQLLRPDYSLATFPAFDPDHKIREVNGQKVLSRLKAVSLVPERKDKVFTEKALKSRFLGQRSSVAIVEFAGNYLLASNSDNPYTFDMLKPISDSWSNGLSVEADASYVFAYYRYLRSLEGRTVTDQCDDTLD